ncbi:MAG: MFS transporter [Clostridiales bacterium]|jgi:MFS family permease|nr:MFS transporter [Clostridiales bacterium]
MGAKARPKLAIKDFLARNDLLKTFFELKGNSRACIFTEPMWGLSMNLCLPYASVYMLALGLDDLQIGVVASVYMFSQMVFAFLSGALVDRFGRRFSTAVFDFFAWSLPCVIWAFAEGFWFFIVAALFNGIMKVTTVSWDCLMVEDAPPDKLTKIYSWVILCGNLSALFAPVASILVSRLTLAPAVRILYINAFVIMTAKLIILYALSTETQVGIIRMKEVKGQKFSALLSGYKSVLGTMFRSRGMMFALFISIIVEIAFMLSSTFWQIIASRRIGVSDTMLPLFPMVRSIISIVLFFTVITRVSQLRLRNPLILGFASYIVSIVILVLLPTGALGYTGLLVSILFDSFGSAILSTLRESIVAINADVKERSRTLAMLQMIVMLISVPFGYIGGFLSSISRVLPFVLIIALFVIGMGVTYIFFRTGGTNK